jgi:DNA topoisomerase-2
MFNLFSAFMQGLGAFDDKDGINFFKNIEEHRRFFKWVDDTDAKDLDMAFAKDSSHLRKSWLKSHPVRYLYLD